MIGVLRNSSDVEADRSQDEIQKCENSERRSAAAAEAASAAAAAACCAGEMKARRSCDAAFQNWPLLQDISLYSLLADVTSVMFGG